MADSSKDLYYNQPSLSHHVGERKHETPCLELLYVWLAVTVQHYTF